MAKANAKTNTKATNNVKEKETNTMEKQANITLELEGSVKELKALADFIQEMGIKATKQGKAQAVEKKSANKTSSKKKNVEETNNSFDREKYEEIATRLHTMGYNGVVNKFARSTIYEAMEEPEMTEEKYEEYQAKLIAIAEEQGLDWYLKKVGVETLDEIEIEDEEELIAN